MTNDKFLEILYDIRDRVTGIEVSLKRLDKVEHKLDDAHDKANKAYEKSIDNDKNLKLLRHETHEDIKGLRKEARWAIGIAVTMGLGVLGLIYTIIGG